MNSFHHALRWFFREGGWAAIVGLLVLVALVGAVTGCESAKVLGGNEHSVVVDPGMTAADGFTIAAQHCAKHGKRPRLAQRAGAGRYVFDCI